MWTVFGHRGSAQWSFLTTEARGATPEDAARYAAEQFSVNAEDCIVFPSSEGFKIDIHPAPRYYARRLG